MFVNKHSQTLRVYNSRIQRIKNADFSAYHLHMNTNIYLTGEKKNGEK